MSEQPQEVPQETPTTPETPTEAPEAPEVPDTPETPEEPAEEPETPETEPTEPETEPEQPQGMTEKEIERAYKALGKLRETVAGRVSAIMGDDALQLVPCPACADVAPGFVWHPEAAPPSEEAALGMRSLLGIGTPQELKQPDDFQACPTCDGHGFIATGSKRDGYDSATCPRCVGKGYLSHGELTIPAPANGNGDHADTTTGPTVFGTELPPEAQALRDQGWMVAPPVQIPTTVG